MKPQSTKQEKYIDIEKLVFKSNDVLETQRARIKRKAQLLRAMMLEGLDQTEVILTFQDEVELKRLKTRVLATGDDSIVLSHGTTLPINCILDVEFLANES